jgi:hypothetical protein
MKVVGSVPFERRQAALRSTEDEIRGERARVLGRAVRALEEALARLASSRLPPPGHSREDLLAAAGERLWFLVIQREALGLNRHEELLRELHVPPEVRRAMGPRRLRRA